MKKYRFYPVTIMFVLALASTLYAARLTKNLSYQELLNRSDLVAIATPISTKDTEEIWVAEASPLGYTAVGVETQFTVSAVLKGNNLLKNLVLHYFKKGIDPSGRGDCSNPDLITIDLTKKHTYLLFLVRESDGRYTAASGQSAAGESVNILSR